MMVRMQTQSHEALSMRPHQSLPQTLTRPGPILYLHSKVQPKPQLRPRCTKWLLRHVTMPLISTVAWESQVSTFWDTWKSPWSAWARMNRRTCRKYRLTKAEPLVSHPGSVPVLEPSAYEDLLQTVFGSWLQNSGQLRNTINWNLQTLGKMCQNSLLVSKVRLGRKATWRFLEKTDISVQIVNS